MHNYDNAKFLYCAADFFSLTDFERTLNQAFYMNTWQIRHWPDVYFFLI